MPPVTVKAIPPLPPLQPILVTMVESARAAGSSIVIESRSLQPWASVTIT